MNINPKRLRGFTLMELMIALVIVGILASVAYPSYQAQVANTRRTQAQADLVEMASFMERFFTENNAYHQDTGGTAVALPFTQSPADGSSKYYNLTLVAGDLAQTTYTLKATPINGQVGNGYLELTHTGVRRWDTDNDNVLDPGESDWEY